VGYTIEFVRKPNGLHTNRVQKCRPESYRRNTKKIIQHCLSHILPSFRVWNQGSICHTKKVGTRYLAGGLRRLLAETGKSRDDLRDPSNYLRGLDRDPNFPTSLVQFDPDH